MYVLVELREGDMPHITRGHYRLRRCLPKPWAVSLAASPEEYFPTQSMCPRVRVIARAQHRYHRPSRLLPQ